MAPPGCTPSAKTMCGTFTAFPVDDAAPYGIVYAPSGALKGLWYTNATIDKSSSVVAFMTGSGTTTAYATPTVGAKPGSINVASDSTLWFTETRADAIATIGASHAISEFKIPTPDSLPLDITRGPDGAMWFTEVGADRIGRLSTHGAMRHFDVGPERS